MHIALCGDLHRGDQGAVHCKLAELCIELVALALRRRSEVGLTRRGASEREQLAEGLRKVAEEELFIFGISVYCRRDKEERGGEAE